MNRRDAFAPALAALAGAAVLAVPRSAAAQTSPTLVFDVRDFGAVGDGVANDAPALQEAIEAAVAVGGTVLLSPGQYRIASMVYVDALNLGSHVSIVGTGGAELHIATPQGVLLHNVDGIVSIRDVVFVGSSTGAANCIVALAIHGAHMAVIERCAWYGMACDGAPYSANWGSALRLYNTPARIAGCVFLGCWARDGVLLIDQLRTVLVADCRFVDIGAHRGVTYSWGGGPSDSWIHVRHVPGDSVTATGAAALRLERVVMDEGAPIRVHVSGPARVPRVSLVDCAMNLGALGVGARLSGVERVEVAGGVIGWINGPGARAYDLRDCGVTTIDGVTCAQEVPMEADAACRSVEVRESPDLDSSGSLAARTVVVLDGEVVG